MIEGNVAPGFERVRDAFAANFARDDAYQELGASLAVYRGGKCVVDLWGGYTNRDRARRWQRDSLINVYSTTKGIAAIAIAMLVDEGKLDYAAPVTRYWPEYGAAGKGSTTVAQLLSHQAGLTGLLEPTTVDDLCDWPKITARLARQPPLLPPGSAASYHAMTWGFLAGEVFRRAAGESIGAFLRKRVGDPLGADVFIGLSDSLESRVATLYGPKQPPDLSALTQPPQALAAMVNPQLDPEAPNQRAWRAAEIPAANGHASAQGLARIYAAIANGGELSGTRLLSRAGIDRMLQRQTGKTDLLLGFTDNWGMGMSHNTVGMLGPRAETFGHSGWGGSFGAANLDAKVSIGYVCNQMGAQLVGDPRGTSLCEAIFAAL
ncbi:MAG TPA: serine hydrolase domain-containing protein [Nevskiaceae bacterium]|nr:serine hydrolase domain-containing protein [Nevskiaceae bacterium]